MIFRDFIKVVYLFIIVIFTKALDHFSECSLGDGEGGKEEPKDHSSRIADSSCVLGSQKSQNQPYVTPIPTSSFKRVARRKPLLRATNKCKRLELANVIGSMTGTGCYGQMKLKLNFLIMYTVGMFAVKRGMPTRKSTSYLPSNTIHYDH